MAKRNSKHTNDFKIETQWPFSGEKVETQTPSLSEFLEDSDQVVKETMVPDRYILKLYKFRLDIVRPVDTVTSCITKVNLKTCLWFDVANEQDQQAYGSHHIQTSGSLVQTKQLEVLSLKC